LANNAGGLVNKQRKEDIMKTKLILASLVALALAVVTFGVTGCKKSESTQSGGTQAKQYTCSMHPDVVKDAPGKCPKCGMELTEKK
jgi:Cu(I)/Ag(I) efflux system membrane fusion protein